MLGVFSELDLVRSNFLEANLKPRVFCKYKLVKLDQKKSFFVMAGYYFALEKNRNIIVFRSQQHLWVGWIS